MTLEEFFWPKNILLRALIFCVDLASLVFIGYWPYAFVWASQNIHAPVDALQTQLMGYDLFPTVFGIFWFSTQYAALYLKYGATWKARFPLITKLLTNKQLGWFLIIAVTVLTLVISHLKGK